MCLVVQGIVNLEPDQQSTCPTCLSMSRNCHIVGTVFLRDEFGKTQLDTTHPSVNLASLLGSTRQLRLREVQNVWLEFAPPFTSHF